MKDFDIVDATVSVALGDDPDDKTDFKIIDGVIMYAKTREIEEVEDVVMLLTIEV